MKTQRNPPLLPLLAMLRHDMMRQCYATMGSPELLHIYFPSSGFKNSL